MKIFITGCAKTGTTLVRRLMNAFDGLKVYNDGEQLISFLVKEDYNVVKRHTKSILSGENPVIYWNNKFVPQTKDILEYIKANNIKIIFCNRNKEDVILSFLKISEQAARDGAKRYDYVESLKNELSSIIDFEIRYENLIDNPDEVQNSLAEKFNFSIKHKWSDYHNWYKASKKEINKGNYLVREINSSNSSK